MLTLGIQRAYKTALVAPIIRFAGALVLDVDLIGFVHRLHHFVSARHHAFVFRVRFLIEVPGCPNDNKSVLA
jgi:hypothetical protein